MVIEGGAIEVGVGIPIVLGVAGSLAMDTEVSCRGIGLSKIGGAGVKEGMGLTGVVWGIGTDGTTGRVEVAPGTATGGLLGLGDAKMELVGGKEGDCDEGNGVGIGTGVL